MPELGFFYFFARFCYDVRDRIWRNEEENVVEVGLGEAKG